MPYGLDEVMKFMKLMGSGESVSSRETALRTETDAYVVDTCLATDTEKWETGIRLTGKKWVIVEDYPDEESARSGHDRWVALMLGNPSRELPSIQ